MRVCGHWNDQDSSEEKQKELKLLSFYSIGAVETAGDKFGAV